nr:immunoglobulin light chain junction region [Macaca mulatta]MOX52237.1 immunoglobulin light chain junction region [Macaca mulatta]MOX52585.1 immunoglobulin light chain junction region [Macaca mulatta]MOX53067.1 immunoglobulin light chain junction region [Macaca mulatta]MOX53172.1 immunoglobulin light chain junction region [Macaca mulatta]
CMQNLEFPFTF